MDYSEGDDDGFIGYIPTTTDPGPWVLIGVSIYSVGCILILPPLVVLGNRWDKRRKNQNQRNSPTSIDRNPESDIIGREIIQAQTLSTEFYDGESKSMDDDGLEMSVLSRNEDSAQEFTICYETIEEGNGSRRIDVSSLQQTAAKNKNNSKFNNLIVDDFADNVDSIDLVSYPFHTEHFLD